MAIGLKQVYGMPVVDSHVARQAGVVEDVLVDPLAGRLAGLSVKHAEGWLLQRVPASHIFKIGPQAVLVTDTVTLTYEQPTIADPRWVSITTLVGMEVLTEGGDRLGYVRDVKFDRESLDVLRFELERQPRAGLLNRRSRIEPTEVVACSSQMMIVSEVPRRGRKRDQHPARVDAEAEAA